MIIADILICHKYKWVRRDHHLQNDYSFTRSYHFAPGVRQS